MSRTKTSITTKKKRKKTLLQAKGFYGSQSKLFRITKQRVMKSLLYSFSDRRKNKNVIRQLWINRINIALKTYINVKHKYNIFINSLKKTNIHINKKLIPSITLEDKKCFYDLAKPTFKHQIDTNTKEENYDKQ
jgi:large subunit ribosomal protein L20